MLLECSEQLLFFFDLRFTDYVTCDMLVLQMVYRLNNIFRARFFARFNQYNHVLCIGHGANLSF